MLIRKLTLEDFGLYRGLNEIDLCPRTKYGNRRAVVLIGGKNGAGKTTLLEALRLCLYGSLSLGNRVGNREYEGYLRSRIHRADSILVQPQSAAVGLEFEYAQGGIVHTYTVKRSWDIFDGGLRSQLSVLQDGRELDGLDRTHADEFLRDMIPQGVSQLYFFDGEKIQELAESDSENAALAAAIRELLGLDLVDTLYGDLRVYLGRLDDLQNTDPLQRELAAITAEKEALNQQLFEATRHWDERKSFLDGLRQDAAREEQRLSRKGGSFASQRETIKAERAHLEQSIRETENEIRSQCEGLLPFVLCSDLCNRLSVQLLNEEKLMAWDAHNQLLGERIVQVKKLSRRELFPAEIQLNKSEQKKILDRLGKLFDRLSTEPEDLPKVGLVHRLSSDQSRRLVGSIERIFVDVPKQIQATQERLEELTRRTRDVQQSERQIPEEDELASILERLTEINRQIPNAAAEAARAEDEVRRIERRIVELDRAEAKTNEKLCDAGRGSDRRHLVGKVQSVLEKYAKVLTDSKTRQLSEAISRRFGELWRKGDVIRRIEVDPKSFEVSLFDRNDRRVRKQELSAGEKQIYAISLLWALADISGRPLPMVIDTPLGRLDSEHRSHLVKRYFPNASHQVIILSTDTEVDRTYFQELAPSLSHAYRIDYDGSEERSSIEEGYFWSRHEEEVVHAGK